MPRTFVKKIYTIALVNFLVSLLFLSSRSEIKAATTDGRFYLEPGSATFKKGCESTINIGIDTGTNSSNAANIIVNYNPGDIEIIDSDTSTTGIQITPGPEYELYADNVVDETIGQIRLTGFSVNSAFQGNGVFGIIRFKSRPGIDSTSLSINFSGVGATLDSNIADDVTSDDILGTVQSGSYTFEEGYCFEDTTPPSIEFIYPKNYEINIPVDADIEIKVCDEESGIDIQSVQIIINGEKYTYMDTDNFTYESDIKCYTITISPKTPFAENTPTLVVLHVEDFSGNSASKTMVFNIAPEASACLEHLDTTLEKLEKCQEDLEKAQLATLPSTGEVGTLSKALGIKTPGLYSIIAIIILFLRNYWENTLIKTKQKNIVMEKLQTPLFVVGMILAIAGIIDMISILSITTISLYALAILVWLIQQSITKAKRT